MDGRLLYISTPSATPSPAVQVTNGGKALLTSIRICAPTNSNGTYEFHHLSGGETSATAGNAIAYNVQQNSKTASEFLTHPLPLSPGESLWISGSNVTVAVYGVVL